MDCIARLLHAVGKLTLEEGEAWRLEHAELMDAYQACQKPPQRQCNNKTKPRIWSCCGCSCSVCRDGHKVDAWHTVDCTTRLANRTVG